MSESQKESRRQMSILRKLLAAILLLTSCGLIAAFFYLPGNPVFQQKMRESSYKYVHGEEAYQKAKATLELYAQRDTWFKQELPGKAFVITNFDPDVYRLVVEEVEIKYPTEPRDFHVDRVFKTEIYFNGRLLVKSAEGKLPNAAMEEIRNRMLIHGNQIFVTQETYTAQGYTDHVTFWIDMGPDTTIKIVEDLPEPNLVRLPSLYWPSLDGGELDSDNLPPLHSGVDFRDSQYWPPLGPESVELEYWD